jgi:hypothetical protein
MPDKFWNYLFEAMSFLSNQPFQPEWELKARLILQAGIFLIIFFATFIYFYRKYFWQEELSRKLFWWTIGILSVVVIAKFAIFYFAKGYIADRLLFFAIPSPKFGSISWFLVASGSFGAFLFLRKYFEHWPAWKFLTCLWLILWAFSLGIAGMRQGSFGIYEPFTRTQWEYTGDLPLVQNIPQFLRDYTILNPVLSDHGSTHPPGYVLILYTLKSIFNVEFFGLAILIAGLGAISIFPVYYFWKNFLNNQVLRRALQVFVFVPSLVMFSATSMDIIMLVFSWFALATIFYGWKHGYLVSFAGGILAGLALLMNFLFLAFGIIFLFFLFYLGWYADRKARLIILGRAFGSLAGFILVLSSLYWFTGYSIINNFFTAYSVQRGVVENSSISILFYLIFAFINVFAFSFYLGIPNVILFLRERIWGLFRSERFLPALGFFTAFLFVATGLFQGEIERIWLFLTPFFLLPISRVIESSRVKITAIIMILMTQIVSTQILFYTYW